MWSIAEMKNAVEVDKKCAKELFKLNPLDIWRDIDEVTYNGKLYFNPDHHEHMDFLSTSDRVIKILKKHKVKGDIWFGSLEGDNSGEFWGYRFDGKGGMKKLTGELKFIETA